MSYNTFSSQFSLKWVAKQIVTVLKNLGPYKKVCSSVKCHLLHTSLSVIESKKQSMEGQYNLHKDKLKIVEYSIADYLSSGSHFH